MSINKSVESAANEIRYAKEHLMEAALYLEMCNGNFESTINQIKQNIGDFELAIHVIKLNASSSEV